MSAITPVLDRALRASLAAAFIGACAVAGPAAAQAKPTQRPVDPVTKPGSGPIVLTTQEDQPLEIVQLQGASVASPPYFGTLLTDRTPFLYVPASDFHGVDPMVLSLGDREFEVSIKVTPVNDAPAFTGGADAARTTEDVGVHEVEGWATGISAGPPDEHWSQRVAFDAKPISDPGQAVLDLKVDAAGKLVYVLSGRPGTATFEIRAFDDGGNRDGGISVSTAHVLRIGVGESVDLSLAKVASEGGYQWVVSNRGPSDAIGARLVEVSAKSAAGAPWTCAAHRGASCGATPAGSGPIDTLVDLPAGGVAVFSVRHDAPGTGLSGFVVPPAHTTDTDLSNNEASD